MWARANLFSGPYDPLLCGDPNALQFFFDGKLFPVDMKQTLDQEQQERPAEEPFDGKQYLRMFLGLAIGGSSIAPLVDARWKRSAER